MRRTSLGPSAGGRACAGCSCRTFSRPAGGARPGASPGRLGRPRPSACAVGAVPARRSTPGRPARTGPGRRAGAVPRSRAGALAVQHPLPGPLRNTRTARPSTLQFCLVRLSAGRSHRGMSGPSVGIVAGLAIGRSAVSWANRPPAIAHIPSDGALWCQMLQSAWVGDRRAARMAGRSPARAPMSRAAARPPAQAPGG